MQPSQAMYLDQCVVSELRTGKPASNVLRTVLSRLEGCAFVYSDVHVREILRSGSPLPYIEALEEIGAYHLPMVDMVEEISTRSAAVTANVVRERIPEQIDVIVAAQLALEQLLRLSAPLDTAGKNMSLESEVEAAIADLDAYLEDVEKELKGLAPLEFDLEPMLLQLKQQQHSTAAEMRSLEAQKLQQEAHEFHEDFSRQLSKEKIDDIPDREIAAFLIDKLPEPDTIRTSYPEGFGRGSLPCGQITGFAFMLFSLGVGRFKRPMRGGSERFVQRLTNQLRDCEHIEQAIRCHTFMTMDDGAARLARAVYGYAGVPNEVILLGTDMQK